MYVKSYIYIFIFFLYSDMTYELTQDSCVLKGDCTNFKYLEETQVCFDGRDFTRLCVGFENKVLILDIDTDTNVVILKANLQLPGFPIEMCFVGKLCMCLLLY